LRRRSCRSLQLTPGYITVLSLFSHPTATTETYTLSLHDALPILGNGHPWMDPHDIFPCAAAPGDDRPPPPGWPGDKPPGDDRWVDRKSTRLNSSHVKISYAVFCLKKKKKTNDIYHPLTLSSPVHT